MSPPPDGTRGHRRRGGAGRVTAVKAVKPSEPGGGADGRAHPASPRGGSHERNAASVPGPFGSADGREGPAGRAASRVAGGRGRKRARHRAAGGEGALCPATAGSAGHGAASPLRPRPRPRPGLHRAPPASSQAGFAQGVGKTTFRCFQ
ncbi:pulmonary surfactant-associated protein D-like [Perognathus longimembris pacificus]|uniref:pulmonary surfactant-associated protein D-like n=1 Tax=Perognathus longimembris pacificus TaxID=214514 RepID=UPI0020186266|nr:pulmonary surfactant-associated protein D-like [Perognathus longimembris pacificus]